MSRAEANGRLRLLRADVAARAEQTRRTLVGRMLDPDVEAMVRRGSERGRQRAAARLRRSLPAVFEWRWIPGQVITGTGIPTNTYITGTGCLLGAYLDAARDPIIQDPSDVGQTQRSIVVAYLVLGTARQLSATGLWTLEVPDHALRRALERDRGADAAVKVRESHAALLGVSVAGAPPLGVEFLIPTSGPGVFTAEWIPGRLRSTGAEMVYARARTWLHEDQLSEDQARRIISPAASGEPSLYDSGMLVPVVLRTQ
jgi:hypothetical protein